MPGKIDEAIKVASLLPTLACRAIRPVRRQRGVRKSYGA